MGTSISTIKMIQISSCSICKELMSHPVSINCGHSYCKSCIQRDCNKVNSETGPGCPLCGSPFSLENLRPNKDLENIIDVIKEMEEEGNKMLCKEHLEKLDLFCEDEGQLLCWRCNWEDRHKGHSVALVGDVCRGYKEKFQETVKKLSELQENHRAQLRLMTKQIKAWKAAIEDQRQRIHSNFENLQRFLHEEEKSYLWRLENEGEQVLRSLKDAEANLQQKYEKTESQVQELEAKCEGPAQDILQDVKNTLSRFETVKLEPWEAELPKVQTTCNVSELYFDVKTLLRCHQVSVTLDPSTAHPDLILSKDRRQVTYKQCHKNLEASTERFYVLPCVLGCKDFTSGRYYFEVSVENATTWDVGVCIKDVPRGFDMKKEPEFGFWTIRMCKKDGLGALTSTPTSLHLTEKPQLVGVFLDYEAGVVSFYNVTSGSHIFTFPKASFRDTLRPFFQVYEHSPLFLPARNDQGMG
ncbi:E3 ubiquitin-protein ligase TRIM38 [Peromyscus californicus insignis]|uniref:E3 ubiquitin-protein ligase TRIM38 n=1 Tax=Peromyscus californicus insignis TaxID=564181 RepID=UPI0022A67889|nr:E3 ubiquitin-protein ligase TRIM38 [Peromyscus californicus insignis]